MKIFVQMVTGNGIIFRFFMVLTPCNMRLCVKIEGYDENHALFQKLLFFPDGGNVSMETTPTPRGYTGKKEKGYVLVIYVP